MVRRYAMAVKVSVVVSTLGLAASFQAGLHAQAAPASKPAATAAPAAKPAPPAKASTGKSADSKAKFKVGHTPWGDPDLQGIWNYSTITPLQRPLKGEYAGREDLSPDEIAKINDAEKTRALPENRKNLDAKADVELAYNQEWWDRGGSIGRTSIITDPKDGRLPAYTKAGRERLERLDGGMGGDHRGYDSYTSRALNERCLVYRPVPVRSSGYNNNNQIVQAPGYVAMIQEQIHEVRIIPLDGRPFTGESIRPWLGVSRGHWEGDTLVVETKNFHNDSNFEASGPNRVVIERFTRTGQGALSYDFTVTDPTTWERPWSGQMPWKIDEGPIFEYACHEGNYGMVNLLRGARTLEQKAASGNKSNQQ
jgi:hypothetical protein